MADSKGNLYLFEAILLRNEYDRHIKLLEKLIGEDRKIDDRFFSSRNEDNREAAPGFNQKELEEKLEKLKTRKLKINQAIQAANFKYQIDNEGEKVSIAEALEIRKNIISEIETVSQRVIDSAYKKIIHKEERDIVHEPKHSFVKVYDDYQDNLKKLRNIVIQIHNINFKSTVNFREE
ncbi:MAG: hypothetical protein FJW56_09110 [Actinobacteria bacterium]|nr:hypothetical protein [Actinomycetota bacterium]